MKCDGQSLFSGLEYWTDIFLVFVHVVVSLIVILTGDRPLRNLQPTQLVVN